MLTERGVKNVNEQEMKLLECKLKYLERLNAIDWKSNEERKEIGARIAATCDNLEKDLGIKPSKSGMEGYRPHAVIYDATFDSQCLDWNDCQIIARSIGDRLRTVMQQDLNMCRAVTKEDEVYLERLERLEEMFSQLAKFKKAYPPGVGNAKKNG